MSDSDAPPKPLPKAGSSSILLLAIILIGFVLAIIFGMKTHRTSQSYQPPSIKPQIADILISAPFLTLATVCVLLILILWKLLKRNFSVHQKGNDAAALFNAGRLDEAETLFSKLLAEMNGSYLMKYNLALVALQQSRFDRAAKLLDECSKVTEIPRLPFVPTACAQLHALNSELAVAEHAYDEAFALTPIDQMGNLALPHALIAIRRGAFKLVADMPSEEWFGAEIGSPQQMRCMRVLRAFAISKMPAGESSETLVKEMLSGARPFRMNEYNYLVPRLPELLVFLNEHGFSTTADVNKS